MRSRAPVLTRRELGRALLVRNLLLERVALPVPDAVEHLVGMQAQEPQEPYVGLWSRLAPYDPLELSAGIERRDLVRTLLLRRTLHLVTARDALAMRPLLEDVIAGRMRAVLRRRIDGVDEAELAAVGEPLFAEPRTLPEAGRIAQERWPDVAARDLGDALSSLVRLVQVPPRGLWRQAGPARNVRMAVWLGREVDAEPDVDALVLRYLAAYGPAASADVRAWSGMAGVREVVARLRPQLRSFRDERGRELLDVAHAPLPDGDVPAPVRYLPAFDNAVLAYDDRSRIIDDAHRGLSVEGARVVLVDGRVAATWTLRPPGDAAPAVLAVSPLRPLTVLERDQVVAEGEALVGFLAADAVQRGVELAPAR